MLETRGMLLNDHSQEAGQTALDWAEKFKLPCAAFASPRLPWKGQWRNLIVWDKGECVAGGGDVATCLKLSWELIQVARNRKLGCGRDGSVWRRWLQQSEFTHHPTEKPVDLIQRLILTCFASESTILDPFMGSGTTGVACIQTGRSFIGIEKDPTYFDIAVKRIDAALNTDRDSLWTAKQLAEQQRPLFE